MATTLCRISLTPFKHWAIVLSTTLCGATSLFGSTWKPMQVSAALFHRTSPGKIPIASWKCVCLIGCFPTHRIVDLFLRGLQIEHHADKYAKNCSGGTRRKLSYALSMLGRPAIVLMDEPSTGMDPQSKRFLWNTISASFQVYVMHTNNQYYQWIWAF